MTDVFYEPKVEGLYKDDYRVYRGSETNRVIWVPPSNYPFYPEDVLKWFLWHLELFEEGRYPPEPTEYVIELGRTKIQTRAYFVIPAELSIEIHKRLDKTRKDGKLLIAEIKAEYSVLSDDACMALRYIKGDDKDMNYTEWKKQRTYLNKRITTKR